MQRAGASPNLVLVGATAAQAAVAFSTYGLPAIEKELRARFHLGLTSYGAVSTATLLGTGFSLIVAGLLVERYGTRVVVALGTLASSAALVWGAFAGSAWALAVALLLSGIGSAAVPVGGAGALFRSFGPERRAWALGVRQMAVPLGGTLSAFLLPALAHAGGVRLALLFAASVQTVCGLGFAAVADAERGAGRASWRDYTGIARTAGMGRILLVASLYIMVLQGLLTYVEASARHAGASRFAAAAAFFAVNVAGGVARVAWGRIADRERGSRRARTLVEVGAVGTAGALLFELGLHVDVALVVVGAAVFGFGALGWNALVYVMAGERAGPQRAAKGVSVAMTVVFVLSSLVTPPLGALAAHAGFDALWLGLAGVSLLAAVLSAGLRRNP